MLHPEEPSLKTISSNTQSKSINGRFAVEHSEPGVRCRIQKDRITTLIDSIYAFAMTLLVITVDIPSKYEHTHDPAPVHTILMQVLPDLAHFFIAFSILALLWYFHHQQFHHLTSLDRPLLCMNIVSLAFVCLIPFSTNIAGDYPLDVLGAVIFEINILAIGLITLIQWYYIRNQSRVLVPHLDPDQIQREIQWSWVFPLLAITGIALAAVRLPWSDGIFLLAPVIMAYLYRKSPV